MHNLSEFPFTVKYIIILLVTAIIALILTPIMVVVSRKIGAVDNPNARRINVKPMPSAGGVAIFVAFSIITLLVLPRFVGLPNYPGIKESYLSYVWPFVLGGGIVAVTGLIDDIMELGAKVNWWDKSLVPVSFGFSRPVILIISKSPLVGHS